MNGILGFVILGEKMEKDYHDYVIKDGKLIGNFDEMYKECENPWHQREDAAISYSRWDTVRTIKNYGIKNVLECGCGLGFFTKLMADLCPESKITGMDVSPNAIRRAKEMFPHIHFCAGNVNDLGKERKIDNYDCIIFSEIMWYILEDLKEIFKNIRDNFNGYIIVNQTFYNGQQKYGDNFFTNEYEMANFLCLNPLVLNIYKKDVDSYATHNVFKI